MPAIDHARYTSGEVLGEGAQGVVLRVIDREQPERRLVAKVPRAPASAASASLAGEFALLARLRVPGLARVHALACDRQGVPFLVEDFVEGAEPGAWVAGSSPRLVALAAALVETLAALHESGFVHGDVKPANVRVPERGRAVLLDLGGAVLLRSRTTVLTAAFAAPELLAGAAPSVASDLHALGATLWAVATSAPPPPPLSRPALRDLAPWITPSVAAVIERLIAQHPADRPRAAIDVLGLLGRSSARAAWETGTRGVHVRERDVTELLALRPAAAAHRVIHVTGPSGAGKSHLVREVATRALLAGRPSRSLRFPAEDPAAVSRLVAFLRGDERAAPLADHSGAAPLLVLDDLHAAPTEVVEALDAFRCMMHESARPLVVLVTARAAPGGAEARAIEGLDPAAFAELCRELGAPAAAREALQRETGGLPGWAAAALGRVPLARDAALARLRDLDTEARAALAVVATLGGSVPADLQPASRYAGAFVAGLLTRDRDVVRLASPQLARDLAEALTSFAVSDHAADLALASPTLGSAALLAAASASSPPARRTELLVRASERAREEGARAVEIEALLGLAASPAERGAARLARLERLTRDAGTSRSHPQVLTWLEEAAVHDAAIAPLAARRRAEERARAGAHEAARAHADLAITRARDAADPPEEGYGLATRGAILLFAADWSGADEAFAAARVRLAEARHEQLDREEVARLEHNAGVVALYRGRVDAAIEAFERSVTIKRALGDRAGIRACLLNLGLALARRDRHDDAERALVEATALADSLGQAAGRAWCLAARADLAVRRRRPREAEQLVAQANAIGDAVPAAVRADLVLLAVEIALLEGDGRAALAMLGRLTAAVRADDALVDARAEMLTSRAHLATLPADRRAAARAAIRAIRRARRAALADQERDGLQALRIARRSMENERMSLPMMPAPEVSDDPAWEVLALLGGDVEGDAVIARLAALVLAEARGERAIVAALDGAGHVLRAWGVDLDGLPIAQAEARLDAESLAAARRRGAVVYQPDVVSRAGHGARLVVAGERAAVVVEHRFVRGAFDHVSERAAGRWGVLAAIAVRVAGAGERASTSTSDAVRSSRSEGAREARGAPSSLYSTAMPRRDAMREFPELLGRSAALRRALAQLDAAVDTELPVVIQGETGTGKELFARALHDHGTRSTRPFVAVNCAAIADALFEAELFGHARGAFTGADRARPGLLARAEGGTLLLDEIGELPIARQATLLRALESHRYRAVGSDDERPFDVRIVAATNCDLDAAVEEGTFRRDLLYRLRVLEIAVPPLRDRTGDVELLLRHFLAKAGSRAVVSPAAVAMLSAHPFPGNVRELLHVAQRLAAAGVAKVDVAHLPRAVRLASLPSPPKAPRAPEARATPDDARAEVDAALGRTGGNISQAAVLLGLSRHGLKKRMLRLGLRARAGEEA